MSRDISPPGMTLSKASGVIQNYRCTRASASFVLTQRDRNQMSMVAVASALARLSGPASSTAMYATDTEEEADYVEFDLSGRPMKGWVWRSPFKEGDEVEVVVQQGPKHAELVAIARPQDRIIALYPHCASGRSKHARIAVKCWLWLTLFLNGFTAGVLLFISRSDPASRGEMVEPFAYCALGVAVFFALMVMSLAAKWRPFAHTSERVFTALGWPNPRRVDLPARTKAQRSPSDPGELGTFYFRY